MLSETYGMTYEEEAEHLREIVIPRKDAEIKRLRGLLHGLYTAGHWTIEDDFDVVVQAALWQAVKEELGDELEV